jgi:hypothetical protein
MANPTSNFNWQMPTPTDLVTDLPADFEVFGQAVDTSLADLKGGTSGQVLAKNSNTDMDFVWVAQDDSNAIQNAIVDAKGDLIAASAADTPARLAVGANDTVLTADSTEATGLKWSAPNGPAFSAYRNGAQTVTANVATKIQLNAETFDTDNCFDSTTNYRFTPTKAGKYLIQLNVIIAGTGVVQIYKNGSNYSQLSVTVNAYHATAALISMNGSSDYIEFYVNTNGTSVYSGADNNFASGVWIRS